MYVDHLYFILQLVNHDSKVVDSKFAYELDGGGK